MLKRWMLPGWFVLSCLALTGAACNDGFEDRHDRAATAPRDADETKEQFRTRMKRAIDNASERIDQLAEQAKDASGEAKEKLDREIEQLEVKRARARTRLEELESETAEGWRAVRKEVQDSVQDLTEATNEAWDELNR